MIDTILVVLATALVLWLFVRFKRHHERLMTELHAKFDEEVESLRAELSGVRLAQQRGQNGR